MKRLAFVTLAVACFTAPLAAQVKQAPAANPDLVYFSDKGPVLFRLAWTVDGQSVSGQADAFLTRWFDKVDRDKDGVLNADELKLAPNAQTMTQVLRGGYYFVQPGTSLSLESFRKRTGEKVTRNEFLDYYRNAGINSLQMGQPYNLNSLSPQASGKLFAMLDTNEDGKLSQEELATSLSRVAKLDGNEDDFIDSTELSGLNLGAYGYQPNQFNNGGLPEEFFLVDTQSKRVQLTALLLAKLDTNKDVKVSRVESMLSKAEFNRLDQNGDNFLNVDELARWTEVRTAVTLDIAMNSKDNAGKMALATGEAFLPRGVTATQVNDQTIQFGADGAQITVNQVNGARVMMNNNVGQYYVQQYRATLQRLDKKVLEKADLEKAGNRILDGVFALADDNADNKLTEEELNGFITFLGSAKNMNLSLSVQKEGRGLFQLIDANKDNRIGLRELLTAWTQLKQADQNGDGFFTEGEVARQYTVSVSQGYPLNGLQGGGVVIRQPGIGNPQPRVAPKGPVWFQKMDVTGDGDVSAREFLGSRELFQQIDSNGDTLIDFTEAEAFSKKSDAPKGR